MTLFTDAHIPQREAPAEQGPPGSLVHASLLSHSVDKQGNTKLAAPTYWGQCFYSLPARIPTLLPRSSSWLIKIIAHLLPRTESGSVTLLCVSLFLYIGL